MTGDSCLLSEYFYFLLKNLISQTHHFAPLQFNFVSGVFSGLQRLLISIFWYRQECLCTTDIELIRMMQMVIFGTDISQSEVLVLLADVIGLSYSTLK